MLFRSTNASNTVSPATEHTRLVEAYFARLGMVVKVMQKEGLDANGKATQYLEIYPQGGATNQAMITKALAQGGVDENNIRHFAAEKTDPSQLAKQYVVTTKFATEHIVTAETQARQVEVDRLNAKLAQALNKAIAEQTKATQEADARWRGEYAQFKITAQQRLEGVPFKSRAPYTPVSAATFFKGVAVSNEGTRAAAQVGSNAGNTTKAAIAMGKPNPAPIDAPLTPAGDVNEAHNASKRNDANNVGDETEPNATRPAATYQSKIRVNVKTAVLKADQHTMHATIWVAAADKLAGYAHFKIDALKKRAMGDANGAAEAEQLAAHFLHELTMLVGIGLGTKLFVKLGEEIAKVTMPGVSVVAKAISGSVEIGMASNAYMKGEISLTKLWATTGVAALEMTATALTGSGIVGEGVRAVAVNVLSGTGLLSQADTPPYGMLTELLLAPSRGTSGIQLIMMGMMSNKEKRRAEENYKKAIEYW